MPAPRIVSLSDREPTKPSVESIGSLPKLLHSFRSVTGWSLSYDQAEKLNLRSDFSTPSAQSSTKNASPFDTEVEFCENSGRVISSSPEWTTTISLDTFGKSGKSEGKCFPNEKGVGVFSLAAPKQEDPTDEQSVSNTRQLAASIAGLIEELMQTRFALWQSEGELAAMIPLVPHQDESGQTAAKLEAALAVGAKALGCSAAALYMLDESTTLLNLRSLWGLPHSRLTQPARPLRGQLADLEALLGHCVILDSDAALAKWCPPEEGFGSAVCVPVSTSTMLLGTLWVFSDEQVSFDDNATNILEVTAGRIAAELEREVCFREGVDGILLKRECEEAQRIQRDQFPMLAPQLVNWQIAGWHSNSEDLGGSFYDWFCLPEGEVAFLLGDTVSRGIPAAMIAGNLKAASRAHSQYVDSAAEVLTQTNLTLWTLSGGDQYADLVFGKFDETSNTVEIAMGGRAGAICVNKQGWSYLEAGDLLGSCPSPQFHEQEIHLERGETIIFFSRGLLEAFLSEEEDREKKSEADAPTEGPGRAVERLGELFSGRTDYSPEQILDILRRKSENLPNSGTFDDKSVLILRRTA